MVAKIILIKIWNILASILAFSFIVGGTIFTYYYANGYRFNPINGQVKQTGVISVQTLPSKAEVFVNEKSLGKSPKVSAVDIGLADIKIIKEQYFPWNKKIPIIPEKSTTLQPNLFLEAPQAESIYSLKAKLIKQIPNYENGSIILLILQDQEYMVLKYNAKKSFWNITDNPQVLYKTSTTNIKKIDSQISPDGNWLMVIKTTNDKVKNYEIVKLDIPAEIIKADELDSFLSDYTISWSENSSYLILESPQDIIAYKYSDGTKYLLLKKNSKTNYIWTTDSDGFFYFIDKTVEKTLIRFSVIQTTLQGSLRKTLLKDVYLQNTDKYINEIRKETKLEYQTLTNAKENTSFSGDLLSFKVLSKANGVIFFTTYSTYWYNQELQKYVMISPYPINLVKLSPDANKLIFFDPKTNEYGVFVFNKIEEDPLTVLGSNIILTSATVSNTSWSHDSQNIFLVDNKKIHVLEYDGTNNHELIELTGSYALTDDLDFLYQTKTDTANKNIEILRYSLH